MELLCPGWDYPLQLLPVAPHLLISPCSSAFLLACTLPLISREVVLLLKSCIFLVWCILLESLGSMGLPICLLIIWGLQLISVMASHEDWSPPQLPEALFENKIC